LIISELYVSERRETTMTQAKPTTPAQEAALARARQLTDFKWTPIRDVPTFNRSEGQTVLKAGEEVTGFPYSSTERTDKFFTENVSIETFLSTIPNPHSKLYQPGHGKFNACNYGIVCNGLVRYAFGIPYRVSTKRWMTIPGMKLIKKHGEYSVEEIKLLDVLYAFGVMNRNHVALITGITKDEQGKVAEIEVSEAIRPTCARRSFSPEKFYEKYKPFSLVRYEKLEEVPLLDAQTDKLVWESGIEKATPRITVDNGNKSNYLVGEEVIISVFSDQPDEIEIHKNGKLIEILKTASVTAFPRIFDRGYYIVKLKGKGDIVEFCVNKAEVRYQASGDVITVSADPCDEESKIAYFDFREEGDEVASLSGYEKLTDDEIKSGCFSRKIPFDGKNFKVYYKNKYGIWTHKMTKIE
jgi:hypothetical protein